MTAPLTLAQAHAAQAPALPGTWKLTAGRAITLKVAHGVMWATVDGPHEGALNDLGDLVLEVGDQVPVAAGQRLVVEAWSRGAPAYFSWDPLPAPAKAVNTTMVLQPLADLRQAFALGAAAIVRLAFGLGRLVSLLVAPPKVARRQVMHRGTQPTCC